MSFRPILLGIPTMAGSLICGVARAVPLVVNGSFETTSMTASTQINTTNVTGWSTTGYNFLYFPGTGTTTGSYTPQYNSQTTLWGTLLSGASNGFPATSPDGGNFVAADGAFETGAITQTINGLITGAKYSLSFLWGGAQQASYTGLNTEQWQVSLGAQTFSTPVANNPSQGFSGWFAQSFTYTATSSTEVLSFLAQGTPTGVPPFALLDGVSLIAVPEPASWMTLLLGLTAVTGIFGLRRHRARAALSTACACDDEASGNEALSGGALL